MINAYDINSFIRRNRYSFPKSFDMTQLTQDDLAKVAYMDFKSPIAAFWIHFFLCCGRLYIGDWIIGIAQLALCLLGGIGLIWIFCDLFCIRAATREKNLRNLMAAVNGQGRQVPTFGINMNISRR